MPQVEKTRPGECSIAQLAHFKRMVVAGGEVTIVGLDQRILQAEWLVFVFDDHGTLAGVGALKRPTQAHITSTFRKSGHRQVPQDCQLEVGWIFVDADNRGKGYSHLIVKAILEVAGSAKLFATTRVDNLAMKRTLTTYGFAESGHSFQSTIRDQKLGLFTRPASL